MDRDENTSPQNADDAAQPAEGEAVDTSQPVEGAEGVEGEAESTEVTLPDVADDLTAAEEADLRATFDALQEQYDERAPQATTIAHRDYLTELRGRQSRIAEELTRRRVEAQEVAESLQQLAEVPALPDLEPALASVGQVTGARPKQAPPAQRPSSSTTDKPRVAAIGGQDSERAGQPLDLEKLGAEAEQIAQRPGWTGKAYLANVPGFIGSEGMPAALTGDNGAAVNDRLIREAQESWRAEQRIAQARAAGLEPSATDVRTAAICEPFDILRDVPDNFNTAEPVSGLWPRRPIGRLALQMTDGIGLSTVAAGVATWSEDDQDDVDPDDPDTWKPCVEVDCPTPRSVKAEAVVACLTFRNDTEMSNPERVRNFQNAVGALRARIKEGRQLQIVDSLSSKYTFQGIYGALPTFVEAINSLIAPLNYVNRENEFGYTVIIPPGLLQVLGIDRANRAFGHEQDAASVLADVQRDLEGVNNVVVSLDAAIGGQPGLPFDTLNPPGEAAEAIPPLSRNFRVRIVDPSAAIYGETGELYEGIERGPDLIRQNRAQWFAEEYFLLAKHGVQPWATVDVSLCSSGARAATVDPADYDCGDAS